MSEKFDHTGEIETPIWFGDKPECKKHFRWGKFLFGLALGMVLGSMIIVALMG